MKPHTTLALVAIAAVISLAGCQLKVLNEEQLSGALPAKVPPAE